MPDLSKDIINSELPDGAIFEPEEDGGLDLFLDGMSENHAVVRSFLDQLAKLRNAENTTILSDLEREFGVESNQALTEAERRERLESVITEGQNLATDDYLQARLRASGFADVYVYQNDPAVDPANFITESFLMVCGSPEAVCGKSDVVCGSVLDDLIINGNLFYTDSDIPLPTNPGYWPFIFFIGGVATRNPVTDEITAITRYTVPYDRRDEFRRLVVKYKPLHSWAAAVVQYA